MPWGISALDKGKGIAESQHPLDGLETSFTNSEDGKSDSRQPKFGKKSWSSFFDNKNLNSLEYIGPCVKNNKLYLPPSTSLEGKKRWEFTPVGFFLEKNLSFHFIKAKANFAWKKFRLVSTSISGEGVLFFRFESNEGCEAVLKSVPWCFAHQHLLLKKWLKSLDFSKEKLITMSVWVKFRNIRSHYWSRKGISILASYLGNPLYTDEMT